MTSAEGGRWPFRRRPTLLAVAVRWRIELAAATTVGLVCHLTDPVVVGMVGTTTAIVVATVPTAREVAMRAWQLVALPHRVRSGLVQAGAANRDGRLPWVLWAHSAGEQVVWVDVKLRSGVTFGHLYAATPYIAAACAAADVRVVPHTLRPDRVRVFLVRPRWGLR